MPPTPPAGVGWRPGRRGVLGALLSVAAIAAAPRSGRAEPAAPVDVALVFAVDVSRSIDENESQLQRDGYREAMTDPRVVEVIEAGALGAIIVAYVEWSGHDYQRLLLPWTRIASQAEAEGWAAALERAPRASIGWTSISGGIDFARRLLAECPAEAMRKVIDISGDGVNNSGAPPEEARDRAVAEGITINGLPILNDTPNFGREPPLPLDEYYRQNVIGGPGAFVVTAENFESFGQALRRKLLREIAGVAAPPAARG